MSDLRNKLIRLAHANPELRGDLLPLLKQARGQRLPLGPVGDETMYWPPEPREWDENDFRRDRFGDYYVVEYHWVGRPSMYLFVEFDATEFIRSEGKRPGSFKATGVGAITTGKFRGPDDVLPTLNKMKQWGEGLLRKLQSELSNVGDSNWDANFDGHSLHAEYVGPTRHQYSDSSMHVTFDDVEDAVINGDRSPATIWYSAGADYQGHHGVKEVERSYSSIQDIEKILAEALRLWKTWDQD